jgi:NAD(P)-dependent dehydrogenase (short-subunit alcohol dehydrogenase family)
MSAKPFGDFAARPLPGRVALITGAGRGIGRAVALALADAGSKVVLGARTLRQVEDVASEVIGRGGEALAVHLDVTDPQSVDEFVATAMDRFGRVDVLVNNAGSNNGEENGAVGPVGEINPSAWWTDIEVNLRGTFLCTHSVLPHMAYGSGHIINVVSMAAVMPWPYDSAYACSKAAVVRLTDSVAEEVRERGIRVFALSPGSVDTELRGGAVDSPAGRQWLTKVNPNPQWVPAELPAEAVVFLVSGAADGLTGRFLSVDWDLPDLARRAEDIERRDVLQLRFVPDRRNAACWPVPSVR